MIPILNLSYEPHSAIFEAQKRRAWTEGGPELIINEAQKRLRKEGWDSVRPALTTTIRFECSCDFCPLCAHFSFCSGYIMRGFMEGSARGNHVAQVEMYTRCIEILEWGRKTWCNIPREERGAIFEPTFIMGVRTMRLEALVQVAFDLPF
jgi:hypothetical protein